MPLSTSTCEAIILEPLTTIMSAVMKVQIHYDVPSSSTTTSNGNGSTAVLKLYDRRFGTTLRRRLDMITPKYEPYPCTSSTEAEYCDFIRKEEVGLSHTTMRRQSVPAYCHSEPGPSSTALPAVSPSTRRLHGTNARNYSTGRLGRTQNFQKSRAESSPGSSPTSS